MNIPLLFAGILSLIATPVHMYGGEFTLRHTNTNAFPKIPNGDANIDKQEIRFGWHMVTLDLLLTGLALVWFSFGNNTVTQHGILYFIVAHFVAYAVVIAVLPVFALHRLEPLYRSPQWLFYLLIAILAYSGVS